MLVVDDDPSVLEMTRYALAHAGFRVVTAQNGLTALEFLRSTAPDAIVLDLAMPEMDSWAVRAAQLSLPGACDVPVVIFSGDLAVEPPAPELAPAAVVRKPAGMGQLVGAVRSVLARSDR